MIVLPNASGTVDVVVVGGGPAGLSTAVRLLHHGRSVALIERGRFEHSRVGEIVPPEIRRPLTELTLWQEFEALKLRPVSSVDFRWGSDELSRHHHVLNPYQQAWVLPKLRFDRLLADTSAARGAKIHTDSVVRRVGRTPWGWNVGWHGLRGIGSISCRYLVDATGRQNAFSRMIGRRAVHFDQLVGVAGIMSVCGASDRNSLLVEADIHGWRYSIALQRDRLACVYLTDADRIPRGSTKRACWWRERTRGLVPQSNGLKLGADGLLLVRPAQTILTRPIADNGFVSVGDSANALDPLSGMGVVRALNGGIQCADALHVTFEGDKSALNEYAADVERDFNRQLGLRGTMYNQEMRWPKSQFWIRRRQSQLSNIPVELDPRAYLRRSHTMPVERILEVLAAQFEDSLLIAIWEGSARPVVAADLASHARIELSARVSDRDIVTGMQAMLEAGALTIWRWPTSQYTPKNQ